MRRLDLTPHVVLAPGLRRPSGMVGTARPPGRGASGSRASMVSGGLPRMSGASPDAPEAVLDPIAAQTPLGRRSDAARTPLGRAAALGALAGAVVLLPSP